LAKNGQKASQFDVESIFPRANQFLARSKMGLFPNAPFFMRSNFDTQVILYKPLGVILAVPSKWLCFAKMPRFAQAGGRSGSAGRAVRPAGGQRGNGALT
jgi:hypothetical protein